MRTPELAALETELRDGHHKLTKPRRAVLDIISKSERHLTPAEVFEKARAHYPHIGLTTVYRTLDLLVELGAIQRIHLPEGCHSYASAARAHGHHLVCTGCGRAESFADCDLDPLMQSLRTRTGFAIDVHMLELMGLCPDCQAKPARRKK
jgi:Fur family transcriptional regulator, ferric uptake regulator